MCGKCEALKRNPPFGSGWHDMETAPRDGTTIEIENAGGGKPWRGLYRWGGVQDFYEDERLPGEDMSASGWRGVPNAGSGFYTGAKAWRAFKGDPETYEDPYSSFDQFDYVIQGKRPTAKLKAAERRYAGPQAPRSFWANLFGGPSQPEDQSGEHATTKRLP